VTFPTPGKRPTGKGSKKRVHLLGLNDKESVWFFPVRRNLGEEFVRCDARGGRQPKFRTNLLANRTRHLRCGRQARLVLRNIEIGFIEGERLDEIGVAPEDLAHLARNGSIARKIRREKDGVRTEAFGLNGGHRRTHAEFPRLIRGRAHHRAVPAPRDDDGIAAQLRIVPLLDGSVECVHVDVHDFAL